jgi:hypothetical protein
MFEILDEANVEFEAQLISSSAIAAVRDRIAAAGK